ncbi:USP6 N-terminal-like protein [Hypsibius exemplaris]|uniref:USP6 N-terminal-like protein n=1 Tax=Hypsibius exemplaris TaxID=2072580 RepID=A0A1W0WZ83_HYPEX|nr:USP6 N-terminal-like protein [Hypsibius exemplaris]
MTKYDDNAVCRRAFLVGNSDCYGCDTLFLKPCGIFLRRRTVPILTERREIVARYDRGRDDNVAIDPWEDPQWEVYHKKDRYGFIHDQRLPVLSRNDNKKMVETEMARVDKWLKMLQNWDYFTRPGSEKLKNRIYKGIPNKVRSEVWLRLLKINEIKQEQEGVYKKMRDLARLHSPEIRQIDLDVNRTYRNHEMFRERYGVKQQALFHVLAAYSMYNTEVGYCQGMSQVAALLLMYMSDEDAFWGLSALLSDRKFAMHGFFIPGFPKLVRFQTVHESILKKNLSKIKKHIDKHDIHTNLYSVKWFFQCFLDRVPFHLCLRLWDIYLFEGERLLIAMAYNVFKMHSKEILKRKSMEGVIDLLQRELELDFRFHDDEVIDKLSECMEELRRQKLDLPVNVENEMPTKPFGLLYHPTVGQVRRFVDSSSMVERNSTSSADDNASSSRLSNGGNYLAGTTPPPFITTVGPAQRHVSEERVTSSRPTSRQMSQHAASVYDNVDPNHAGRGNSNRIRPADQLTPSSSPISPDPRSRHSGAGSSSFSSAGDHRYVSVVQVATDGHAHDRVVRRADSAVERTEMITTKESVGSSPVRRSPLSPGLPKVTPSQIQSQRESLKTTPPATGVTRYGAHHHDSGGGSGGSRISHLDPVVPNGNATGATVIRIGMSSRALINPLIASVPVEIISILRHHLPVCIVILLSSSINAVAVMASTSVLVVELSDSQNDSSPSASAPKLVSAVIDLTQDEVVPSGSKGVVSNSRAIWRERHKNKDAATASTSGSTSTRMNTRSHNQDLNSTLEIVEVESTGTTSGSSNIRAKRRGDQSDEGSKQSKRKPEVEKAKTPPPEEVAFRCPVCLDSNKELKERNEGLVCLTVCGHVLCKSCSGHIFQSKECPVCRKKIKGKSGMHPIYL